MDVSNGIQIDEENEIIDRIVDIIEKSEMAVPAKFLLESLKPFSSIGSQLGTMYLAPWLQLFGAGVDTNINDYLTIFEKKENVEKLIKKIDEMEKQKEERKKIEREKKKQMKGERKSILEKVKSWFKSE